MTDRALVHYSDWASQPHIRIACDQTVTTPKRGERSGLTDVRDVYQADDDRLYTFGGMDADKLVTCPACKPLLPPAPDPVESAKASRLWGVAVAYGERKAEERAAALRAENERLAGQVAELRGVLVENKAAFEEISRTMDVAAAAAAKLEADLARVTGERDRRAEEARRVSKALWRVGRELGGCVEGEGGQPLHERARAMAREHAAAVSIKNELARETERLRERVTKLEAELTREGEYARLTPTPTPEDPRE